MTKAKAALFLACIFATFTTACGGPLVSFHLEVKPDTQRRYLTTHCQTSNNCTTIYTAAP